ncbi:MAG: hypothetical protein O2820_03210 [Planctomycetota bacterium]|nr:hypothetical protein [Planctomycetota bacterium]MDA1248210.1 hypothetical protein [Planctomycetota bacterium]
MSETTNSPDANAKDDVITRADPTNVKPNFLFRLVILFSAAFLLTILLLLATTFSSSRSSVKQLLDLYGLQLIGLELAAILVSGFFAMALDRRQTLAKQAEVAAISASSRSNANNDGLPPARLTD